MNFWELSQHQGCDNDMHDHHSQGSQMNYRSRTPVKDRFTSPSSRCHLKDELLISRMHSRYWFELERTYWCEGQRACNVVVMSCHQLSSKYSRANSILTIPHLNIRGRWLEACHYFALTIDGTNFSLRGFMAKHVAIRWTVSATVLDPP